MDEARGVAAFAAMMPDAAMAFAVLLDNAPEPPALGTGEHRALVAGKDLAITLAVMALNIEQERGRLKHLSPQDKLLIIEIIESADAAGSAHLGVDVFGEPLA
jgi:hypothetical protein